MKPDAEFSGIGRSRDPVVRRQRSWYPVGMASPNTPAREPNVLDVLPFDQIEAPVQRFLEGVVASPNLPVVEMNGHRVYFVVRPAIADRTDEPWTPARNHRRCDLIDREIDGTITPDEAVELEGLQGQMRRYVNKVAPLPLAAARKLHADLLEKAALASGPS